MSVTIRPIAETDRADWEALWRANLAYFEVELPQSQTEANWAQLIDPSHDPFGLVAVDADEKAIGIAHYLFHPSFWTAGPYCYGHDLFVAEAARGTGVGRALIEAVFAAADEAGAGQVYWLVLQGNQQARRLYDRIGQPTGHMKYKR